ncbi:uncharacterized protein LOC117152172 [Bombus impatiens]|uniref:Uncharacterized protein LOC117152172 n=1 Tax=Bombus impatiens TaxID=132113 RepID=A0A6P8M0P6_BOMIM|nr:uncharacterized protein LOC117152172 [Bombus impatiens]
MRYKNRNSTLHRSSFSSCLIRHAHCRHSLIGVSFCTLLPTCPQEDHRYDFMQELLASAPSWNTSYKYIYTLIVKSYFKEIFEDDSSQVLYSEKLSKNVFSEL